MSATVLRKGADNVRARLLAILGAVQQQPRAGTPTNRTNVFRVWVRPYPYVVDRGGSGKLHRCGEWSFCLTAARMVAAQEKR